ncbi:MAG: serine O-acetyltransferase, partial [Ruminococcus sp.]|nr:serine O-acetyltransferase [Ruminococcus sp.]
MNSFTNLISHFKEDIRSVKRRDPAAKNTLEIILTYSGLHAVAAYRVSHYFYTKKMYLTARAISQ